LDLVTLVEHVLGIVRWCCIGSANPRYGRTTTMMYNNGGRTGKWQ